MDDEPDIRDIVEMTLKLYFDVPIICAVSGEDALEVLKTKGMPSVVVSDYRMPNGNGEFLFQELKKVNSDIPFVICSADSVVELRPKFPGLSGHVEKPQIIKPLVEILTKLLVKSDAPQHTYVPIKIRCLLRLGDSNVDVYIKLGEGNFKKIIKCGDPLASEDANRYIEKGVHYLYLTTDGATRLIKSFEKNLSILMDAREISKDEKLSIGLSTLEQLPLLGKHLGWGPDCINAATKSVNYSISILAQNPDLSKILKKRLQTKDSDFAKHVGLLSIMSCALAIKLGWETESTLMKIGMACVLHDITVDESVYSDIDHWNKLAKDFNNNDPKVKKFRMHPLESAELIKGMKNVPPDLDQLVLQHHEAPDGAGYPRKLPPMNISAISSLIIIVHDLVDQLEGQGEIEDKLQEFIYSRENYYSKGSFRKVYECLRLNVQGCKKKVS